MTTYKPLIVAELNDGYTFRNLIEYFKCTNTAGNFVFDANGIGYEQQSANSDVLNKLVIRRADLTSYHFDPPAGTTSIPIGIAMMELRNITKSIGKKDSVQLFTMEGQKYFFIRPMSQMNKSSAKTGVSYVLIKDVEQVQYSVDGYTRPIDQPNCTAPVADFAKMCTSMSTMKFSYVLVKGYPRGISFEGIIDGNITGKIDRFGDCTQTQAETNGVSSELVQFVASLNLQPKDVTVQAPMKVSNIEPRVQLNVVTNTPQLRIGMQTIKALSKLNNLCPNGTLRLTLEDEMPLRLTCKIGSYGELTIYIRENTQTAPRC